MTDDDDFDKWVAFFTSHPIPKKLLDDLAKAPILRVDDPIFGLHQRGLEHRRGSKRLTKSERVVLFLASHGLSSRQSAELLGKSYNTIQKQRRYAIAVLDAKNITDAVAIAIRTKQI